MHYTTFTIDEEDYEILRNEANAGPQRFTEWDTHRQFRWQYAERGHTEYADPPQQESGSHATSHQTADTRDKETHTPESPDRSQSSASGSSATSMSSHRDRPAEIKEIRTQLQRGGTSFSTSTYLHQHPIEQNPEAVRRIETHRSQHQQTVGARAYPSASRISRTLTGKKTEKPLPPMGAGKPYPPLLPDCEEFVVEYHGAEDPLHAQN